MLILWKKIQTSMVLIYCRDGGFDGLLHGEEMLMQYKK